MVPLTAQKSVWHGRLHILDQPEPLHRHRRDVYKRQVLIPVRCDNFSLEGFETTLAMILDLETREDVKIDILGVVLTQVERTAAVNLVRQMFEENPEYASVLFKTGIDRKSTRLNSSH